MADGRGRSKDQGCRPICSQIGVKFEAMVFRLGSVTRIRIRLFCSGYRKPGFSAGWDSVVLRKLNEVVPLS